MSLLYKFREEGDKRNVHFGKLVCIKRYQFYPYPQAATKSWFQIEGKKCSVSHVVIFEFTGWQLIQNSRVVSFHVVNFAFTVTR